MQTSPIIHPAEREGIAFRKSAVSKRGWDSYFCRRQKCKQVPSSTRQNRKVSLSRKRCFKAGKGQLFLPVAKMQTSPIIHPAERKIIKHPGRLSSRVNPVFATIISAECHGYTSDPSHRQRNRRRGGPWPGPLPVPAGHLPAPGIPGRIPARPQTPGGRPGWRR